MVMAAADVKAFITGYDIKLTKIPKKLKKLINK
jgi:hypothetical protein